MEFTKFLSVRISTSYEWFHRAADAVDLARDYEPWAVDGFSGVLAVDELYDGYCVLVATDPLNDKTISVRLCESASKKELSAFLLHLQQIGIHPQVFVTDGLRLYEDVPNTVWLRAEHQLCIFHYTRSLTRRVLWAVGAFRKHLKEVGLKADAEELWKLRYAFVTRQEHLSGERQRMVLTLCQRYHRIKTVRQFMLEAFALLDPWQTKQDALSKRKALVENPTYRFDSMLRKAIRSLDIEHFRRAITFLDYANCPRTSNHVERANRYYRKRAKIHYRNRTKRAIWNMVKTDLMVRKANHGDRPPHKLQPRIEGTEILAA